MEHTTRYSGCKLGGLLAAQGRKRRWLAARVGVSESSISRIISGKQTASAEVAERIAAVLQVPLFFVVDVLDSPKLGPNGKEDETA